MIYLVHQFYPEYYTGTEKFILQTAKMQQKNGHQVKVVTYSFLPHGAFTHTVKEMAVREYDYEGVPVLAFRHQHFVANVNHTLHDAQIAAFASEILSMEKPDIVHMGHPLRVGSFAMACKEKGIPYAVTLTDFYFQCPKGILVRTNHDLCDGPQHGQACETHCQLPAMEHWFTAARAILQQASCVIAPSQFVAGMLSREYGVPVYVIHHGINYNRIARNEKRYGPGDTVTLFYGGSLAPHKGVHLILQAAKQVDSDRLRIKLYGSGHDHYVRWLHELAAGDPRISFGGIYTEQELPSLYQQIDVAIVPSMWYENYPLSLHEALASGVPAIVANAGGMAERIQDGRQGFTFPIGDVEGLAARMRILAADPARLNEFKAHLDQMMIPTIEQETYAYERLYYGMMGKG